MLYLNINDVGEVSWFLEVVESTNLHELSDNLIGHLVTPLIDHWHVDVINEDSHLLTSGWSICTAHSLVHVALYRTLWKIQKYLFIHCMGHGCGLVPRDHNTQAKVSQFYLSTENAHQNFNFANIVLGMK